MSADLNPIRPHVTSHFLSDELPIPFGKTSGDKLSLGRLSPTVDDNHNHVRRAILHIGGKFTLDKDTNNAILALFRAIERVLWDVKGVKEILNARSESLIALYRSRHDGDFPFAEVRDAAGALITDDRLKLFGGWKVNLDHTKEYHVKMEIPYEFAAGDEEDDKDNEVAVKMLADSFPVVSFGGDEPADEGVILAIGSDATATIDLSGLTYQLELEVIPRPYVNLASLPVFEELSLRSTKQDNIPLADGMVTHAFIRKDDADPTATDMTKIGLASGDYKITEVNTPASVYYRRFNRNATTQIRSHLYPPADGAKTFRDFFLPLGQPPKRKVGRSVVGESLDGARRLLPTLDTLASEYTLCRRVQLYHGGGHSVKQAQATGVDKNDPSTTNTASGRAVVVAKHAAVLPIRVQKKALPS